MANTSSLLPWQQPPPVPANVFGSSSSTPFGGSSSSTPYNSNKSGAVVAVAESAAGCCVSHLMPYISHDVNDKKSRNAHQCDVVWNKFQSYLKTPDFAEFCTLEGIIDPSIVLCQKSSVWEAFRAQLEKDSSTSLQLGVVFHGTAEHNIPSILKSGLDPKRRSGQAYGVGEYFSKNPSTSLGYCKGGNKMLVFCVVIPSTSSHVNKPQDFVIVEQTLHQVPMAILEFSGASAVAIARSQQIRSQLQHLNILVQQANAAAKEAQNKAKIIQLLIHNELQSAAHKFRTEFATFSDTTKLEISYWAHMHADAEFVQFYFNGENDNDNDDQKLSSSLAVLPPSPDWNTFQNDIVSVEAQQEKLDKAWANVKECQEKLKAEVDSRISNNNKTTAASTTSTTLASSSSISSTRSSSSSGGNNSSSSPRTFQSIGLMAASYTQRGLAPFGLLQDVGTTDEAASAGGPHAVVAAVVKTEQDVDI